MTSKRLVFAANVAHSTRALLPFRFPLLASRLWWRHTLHFKSKVLNQYIDCAWGKCDIYTDTHPEMHCTSANGRKNRTSTVECSCFYLIEIDQRTAGIGGALLHVDGVQLGQALVHVLSAIFCADVQPISMGRRKEGEKVKVFQFFLWQKAKPHTPRPPSVGLFLWRARGGCCGSCNYSLAVFQQSLLPHKPNPSQAD